MPSKGVTAMRLARAAAQQHEMQHGHGNAHGHDVAAVSTDRIGEAPKGAADPDAACQTGVKVPGAIPPEQSPVAPDGAAK